MSDSVASSSSSSSRACPTAPRRFQIKVPATSANIGPGFDVVGLSLSLHVVLDVSINPSNAEETTLAYTGEGAAGVPLSPFKNLITRTALYVLRAHGIKSLPPNLHVAVDNGVPFGRGLGSSGAAVIAGVLLGSLLGDLDLPLSRLLDFALMVERHPDNVSAALVGGFVGSYLRELSPLETSAAEVPLAEVLPEYPADAGPDWGLDPPIPPRGIGHFVRFGWAKEIKAIAIVPRFELSTAKARGVLPEAYTRKDMASFLTLALRVFLDHQVFNLQRLAVLTTALGQSPPDADLIYEAMKDRIHQPYRNVLIPGLPTVLSSHTPSTHPGLLGICLSGAGPTILALAVDNFSGIAESVRETFRAEGVEVDWHLLEVGGGSEVWEDGKRKELK